MPVVTVTAAPHPHIGALLSAVADGVAAALSLGAGDVIATHIVSGASVVSGADAVASASAWPLVSIHGSDRGREKMESARSAAETAVRHWAERQGVECEGVWTQCLTPLPA